MGERPLRFQYHDQSRWRFETRGRTDSDSCRDMIQKHRPIRKSKHEAARFHRRRLCFSPAALALAAAHARVELPQHNAWPSLVSRRPPLPEECTLCVRRMLCASRPFERPIVPINTAVDPHELRFPRRMRRTRPAPACSASNLSRLVLTRVDALWLECQWCRQRIKTQRQDVVLAPAHAIQMPAAAVI